MKGVPGNGSGRRAARPWPRLTLTGPALLAVATTLVAGCGGAADRPAAGEQPPGTPVAVGEEPRLSVGVLRGDTAEQFHDVVTPFLLPDGRLAVPLRGSNVIRIFSPHGAVVERLGGSGEGPGEFLRLDGAWHRGDTVEAWDAEQRRVTRFPPGGAPEVITFESAPGARRAIPGVLPGGWAAYGVAAGGFGGRDSMAVHLFGRDGRHRGRIAVVEGMRRERTGSFGGPTPLSPRAVLDVASGRVYVAETATPRARIYAPDGALAREVTWPPGDCPAPQRAFEVVVDSIAADEPADRREDLRRRLESFAVPDTVPAFWDLIVDEEGFLWVEAFDPARHSIHLTGTRESGEGGTWFVLSPDGRRVADALRMPAGFSPREITADAVVGVHRNDLGVESVRVYPLRRR